MLQAIVNGSKGSEMFIDYHQGVGFTVVLKDGSQYDFCVEEHEWETLKKFLDNQKAAQQTVAADAESLPEQSGSSASGVK